MGAGGSRGKIKHDRVSKNFADSSSFLVKIAMLNICQRLRYHKKFLSIGIAAVAATVSIYTAM